MSSVPVTTKTKHLYIDRIASVQPDGEGKWGKLDALGMIVHLRRTLETSLGEVEVEDRSNFITRTLGKTLVLYLLPIPKGKIKAPDYFTPLPEKDFEEERKNLIDKMDLFTELLAKDPENRSRNPVLGMLTRREWSRLHALHMDHHLRQFGA